jgi:curli biogenesis system outer membrane secretion channel CsgG
VSRDFRLGLAGLLAIVAITAGCAAHAPIPAPVPGAPRDTLALLPLENLSGRAEYGDRLTRIVWTELAGSGRWDVVEEGEVDAALSDARVRSALSMTRDQVQQVAKRTGARWLVAGTIIECRQVSTPDGEVPTVALALRLIDGETGRVRWTEQRTRSGEDRETVFGWGRVTNVERLAQETTRELVAAIRLPAEPDSLAPGGSER